MSTTSPTTSRASASAGQAADDSRDTIISATSGLPSSCDRCRRRKSRCDRGFPSCQRCISAQVTCQYGNRRRPGFSAGHRQVLESRIRELEGVVQNLQGNSSQHSYPTTRATNYSLQHESDNDGRLSHENVSQDDFNTHNLNQGPTPASTHDSNREGQEKPDMPSKPSDWVFQGTFARTVALVERRPPLDLVVSSTSVFFRHIHPWFPFLDSQLVLNDLAGVQEPALLHYAIFGASIPFLFDPRLDDTRSDSFWKYTKRRIFVETSEEPSYAGLEAATILTLDLSGMTNGPQVWSRLAVVCRLAAQLRTASGKILRQSAPGSSWSGRSAANRPSSIQHAKLFWSIYALDSLISITTSQPGLLTEHILRPFRETREAAWSDQDTTFPEGAGTSSRPQSSSAYSPSAVFLYFLQLLDISRTFHDLYLTHIGLDRHDEAQATAWLESCSNVAEAANNLLHGLPSWCQIPIDIGGDTNRGPPVRQINSMASDARMRDTQAPIIMLHAYGHALTIYLNGLVECSNYQGLLAHAADSQHSASIICRQSVRAIAHISAAFVDVCGDRIGWPFAWSIWTAARYLLSSMYAARSSQPPPDFYTLLSCLREMGKYWQISKKYWWLLHHAANAAVGTGEGVAGSRDGQSIIHGDNERLLNPRRILAIVTDLRVPTSDVEDQFRVDPVFAATSASESSTGDADADAPPMDCQSGTAFASGREADVDHSIFLDDMTRDDSLYWSDTWFNTPLFATSGYQQLGEGPDGIMDSTMRLA